MKQQSKTIRDKERRDMLLKSLELSKHLGPEQRFEAFLELQEAMVRTYFDGLQARNPHLSTEQLLELARKEKWIHGK